MISLLPGQNGSYARSCVYRLYFVLQSFLKCHVQCGQVLPAVLTILPFMEDMQYRVKKRIVGNIAGVLCFTALYFLLPSSIYAYIGILGGIGVGFSAKYGWQAVFNTFGALAIAAGFMD